MFIINNESTLTYINYTQLYKGFNVTEFGKETQTYSKSSAPKRRENYIIHFVTEGNGIFHRDDKTYSLYPGRAFVITPNNLVSYSPSKDSYYSYYWIAFSGIDCDAVFKACGLTEDIAVFDFTPSAIEKLTPFLDTIQQEQEDLNSKAFELSVYSMAYEVLANCSTLLNINQPENKQTTSSIIDKAVEYMQANFSKPLNISQLCYELGISRAYFTTEFKKTLKQSPYRYLTNLRIQQSSELLIRDKNLFIYNISELVGFSSVAQFCKVFYKLNGVTPSEFRELYGKKD